MFQTIQIKILAFAFLVLWSGIFTHLADAAEHSNLTKDAAFQLVDKNQQAQLFLSDGKNKFFAAEGIAAHADISIAGFLSNVTLYQVFHNTSDQWVEGFYVYPLPENTAVDQMEMIIADRIIKGEIKEKREAKIIYEKAKKDGKTASLVSSRRPNIFSTSLANIGPGQRIVVKIGMKFRNRLDGRDWSFRFPLVVAPRYGDANGSNSWFDFTSPSDDLAVNSPVPNPDESLPLNPFSLALKLDAGLPIDRVQSLNHKIAVQKSKEKPSFADIELASTQVPSDQDFVLEWRTVESVEPQLAVFKEDRAGLTHVSALVMPPMSVSENQTPLPRDLIIILDTSGSMDGPSIAQAKGALQFALRRLTPQDRFNIIAFDNLTSAVFPNSQFATRENKKWARRFVDLQRADGGTEMMPALALALAEKPEEGRMRQIVFITDGAVGYEDKLLTSISDRLDKNRIFTVGIGSAPNSYFMTKLAEVGRGTYSYISDVNQVKKSMSGLMSKLENPLVTDIKLSFASGVLDRQIYPNPLPDLYVGEPVEFNLRFDKAAVGDETASDLVTLAGKTSGQVWKRQLDLTGATNNPGVAAVWARAKVEQLESNRLNGTNPETVRKAVLDVALDYSLVTAYTSLVAVEQERSRPADQPLNFEHIATNLPAGWSFEKVFGPSELYLQSKDLKQSASDMPAKEKKLQKVRLPGAGTEFNLLVLLGLMVLLVAVFIINTPVRRVA